MEKEKRNRMLARLGIVVVFVAAVAAASIFIYDTNLENQKLSQHSEELQLQNQDLSAELISRDSVINDLIGGFDLIAENLQTVRQRRDIVNAKSNESIITKDKREEIIKDIQLMNSLLDESRNKINQLNAKLKSSGMQTAELQKKIDDLNKIIEVQANDITELKETLAVRDFEMARLNQKMDTLHMEILAKEDIIEQQIEDLHRAYYTYGTYKELKEKGLLTKEGGFLFLGQNKSLRDDFNEDYFTEIDITKVKSIPVKSKNLELITDHPEGSYRIIENTGDVAYLEIENPDEFWKLSKYVVMEVK